MRYLVVGEYVETGAAVPLQQSVQIGEQVIIPSFDVMARLESEKKIVGGIVPGARAGAFIADVGSVEELNSLVEGLPFWGLCKWTITPLQDFAVRAAQDRQYIATLKVAMG